MLSFNAHETRTAPLQPINYIIFYKFLKEYSTSRLQFNIIGDSANNNRFDPIIIYNITEGKVKLIINNNRLIRKLKTKILETIQKQYNITYAPIYTHTYTYYKWKRDFFLVHMKLVRNSVFAVPSSNYCRFIIISRCYNVPIPILYQILLSCY